MRATSRFALLSLALAGSVVGVGVQATASAAGFTTLELPLASTNQIRLLLPEGWAFFTRNPREPWPHYYAGREGRWVEIGAAPLADADNAFGLRRDTRRQGVEAGILLTSTPESAWSDCPLTELDGCLTRSEVGVTLTNPSPTPTLCGEIGLVMYPAVPFAWMRGKDIDARDDFAVPTRFVKAAVQCR